MDIIDTNAIMNSLKDFQRQTVNYVFRRLYLDEDRVNRFLIADEVGLGKTLVAKGIIAKAIERLWEEVDRIDILYICANRDIARQNVNRLNVTSQQEFQLASRLTLLPLHMKRLHDNRLNFISFTPQTSFDLRSAEGIARERAMIYHILREGWDLGDIAGPKNVLQCGVGKENWRSYLATFLYYNQIDNILKQKYLEKLDQASIKPKFLEMCDSFAYARQNRNIPYRERQARLGLVGELRSLLAESCISALEPDLVILDEFQRFRDLLDGDDEMAQLARRVFEYPNVKILLLSATPYKMYTMYHESATDNHYDDFIRTVSFLLNDDNATASFKEDLQQYRKGLIGWSGKDNSELLNSKAVIEKKLKQVMVRTERVSQSIDRSSMVTDKQDQEYQLEPDDVNAFKGLDKIASTLKVGDTVEYWKSAPYLLNMMERSGYEIKKYFIDSCQQADIELIENIKSCSDELLSWQSIKGYSEINPRNYKLRALINNKVDAGGWQLLWVPASLPYYQVETGPYARPDIKDFTKALVFSSWVVVPKVIAMLTSYEAERRMVAGYDSDADYSTERTRRTALLRFAISQGRPSSMSTLLLLYPCLTLAREFDPLLLGLQQDQHLLKVTELLEQIQSRLHGILDPMIEEYRSTDAENDERWYWVSLALLDSRDYWPQVSQWLNLKDGDFQWQTNFQSGEYATTDNVDISGAFSQHISQFANYSETVEDLGYPPKDLFEVLSKIAVASPGVVSVRSLLRRFPDTELINDISWLLGSAGKIAMGFRTLFNLPESITLIRKEKDTDDRYWEAVLDYCVNGNLQAVVDEYTHILNESLGLRDMKEEKSALELADEIYSALSIRTAGPEFDEITPLPEQNKVDLINHQIRCRYALRYGKTRSETEGGEIRADQIRSAFNSPFRPFVLATTSIGQEGLDFHQYCHEIYHWNLPSNPVDLEQREGRIHRYKGHVIRKNLARDYPIFSLANRITKNTDPWEAVFNQALKDRKEDQSDLVPFWIYESDEGYKVYRYIPLIPLSRDNERLQYLTRTVAAYRMVLGQPRQEDLVNYLVARLEGEPDCESILQCQLDLSPPKI